MKQIRGAAIVVVFSSAIIGFTWAVNLPNRWSDLSWRSAERAKRATQTRTLTFAERVAYQRAIEGVYWQHRIWPRNRGERPDPKPALDTMMSQAQLEKKVEDYLRDSQTLEDHWQRPITAEQLQAEMDRMAQHTKQPEVLRELFAALDSDPFVIAECLARPVLSERMVAKFDADDKERLDSSRARGEKQMPKLMVAASADYTLPAISDAPDGCIDDTWKATSTTNAPTARSGHTAVWTGSEMLVWGGGGNNTGGRYNPSTDSWTATSTTNAPTDRDGHRAVWTGSEMIVWGGVDQNDNLLDSGGRYNPSTDSWRSTSTTNAPAARTGYIAVWTGSEMIVWGGCDTNCDNSLSTGGRYNPGTNTWTATSTIKAPTARVNHTAVWTGSEMIVWGGTTIMGVSNTGGRYNPNTDNWTATSPTNAPAARYNHTAVWTGSEMIVWGGAIPSVGGYVGLSSGGRYDPSTNSWTATSTTNAPTGRGAHRAIWTGNEMIVWGGSAHLFSILNTGGRYNPSTDSWRSTSPTNAPSARVNHTAVWTGSEMIVWGGTTIMGGFHSSNTGGRYCAQPASLTNISTRLQVLTGDNVLIGGLIIGGSDSMTVLFRALGPTLSAFNVPGVLADPTLELHTTDNMGHDVVVATNDNWKESQQSAIVATGEAPPNDLESAILRTLAPGNYTVIVRGKNNETGVALVDAYHVSTGANSELLNLSSRGFVDTNANVMIGGFIVGSPSNFLVRALGPTLGAPPFNIPGAMTDPTLELHDANGAMIASNDNWKVDDQTHQSQQAAITATGKAPPDDSESAILRTLAPGNYTAILKGKNNTTGIALVEVYNVP
jgi:N-acetylneuraminic acid mutarotase